MYTELPELCIVHDYIECVFVKICHMNQTLIVGVVYRPPTSNIADFNDCMHLYLRKLLVNLVTLWEILILIFWSTNYILQQRNS